MKNPHRIIEKEIAESASFRGRVNTSRPTDAGGSSKQRDEHDGRGGKSEAAFSPKKKGKSGEWKKTSRV